MYTFYLEKDNKSLISSIRDRCYLYCLDKAKSNGDILSPCLTPIWDDIIPGRIFDKHTRSSSSTTADDS